MQVLQIGILFQVKFKFQKYRIANFGYSKVFYVVLTVSMVFLVKL